MLLGPKVEMQSANADPERKQNTVAGVKQSTTQKIKIMNSRSKEVKDELEKVEIATLIVHSLTLDQMRFLKRNLHLFVPKK